MASEKGYILQHIVLHHVIRHTYACRLKNSYTKGVVSSALSVMQEPLAVHQTPNVCVYNLNEGHLQFSKARSATGIGRVLQENMNVRINSGIYTPDTKPPISACRVRAATSGA